MICGTVGEEVDKLDISAFPVNDKAKVEMLGNEKLAIGENSIKIIVTSENSRMQKTYTLKINKAEANSLVDVESNDKKIENNQSENDERLKEIISLVCSLIKENATVLLLYALVWVEFIQVVYLYERLKRVETKEEIREDSKKYEDKNEK